MGHHYVPRKYLVGFAEPGNPDAIWMYDKKLCKFTNPNIKSIAQESGFYSAADELELNKLVERPANLVLDKLRNEKRTNEKERADLAIYIATMFKRVPKARARALSLLPGVLEDTISELKTKILEMEQGTKNKSLVDQRMIELEKAELSLQIKTPQTIIDQIRLPWPSENMIRMVYTMSWYIVHSTGPDYFLTSDNPAFFFEAYGLGRPDSELTFPIATDLALFGCWQGQQYSTNYGEAKQKLVKEANTRLASGAKRFIFYHKQERWVAKVSDNPRPFLSKIRW